MSEVRDRRNLNNNERHHFAEYWPYKPSNTVSVGSNPAPSLGGGTSQPVSNATRTDKFGIAKIYPTAIGGREYFMNMNATTLAQLQDGGRIYKLPKNTTRNTDGSWRIWKLDENGDPNNPRWVITTPVGMKPWRNVEITAQMKLIDAGGGEYLQMYCRGEAHNVADDLNWHGSANKARLRFDGFCGFIKELYHRIDNSGYSDAIGYEDSGFGNILDKWVTWKFVCRNKSSNTQAKLEIWVDVESNNVFQKVIEYTDDGSWPVADESAFDDYMGYITGVFATKPPIPYNRDTGEQIVNGEVITWAGEYLSFRSDNSTYDFKNVSGREIDPL